MSAKRYRKRPIEIEAVQFAGTWGSFLEIQEWSDRRVKGEKGDGTLTIETLEGTMTAVKGDWIIRGVKGELYPCKPDIFAATYEPVGEL